jgi:cupin 2 domain-containing protein
MKNIFSSIPDDIQQELFQDILTTDNFKIERILSKGHSSPAGYWYDQDKSEWVILLKGSAGIRFEDQDYIQCRFLNKLSYIQRKSVFVLPGVFSGIFC